MDIMEINNEGFATDLVTLAIMCASKGSDSCNITIDTSKGKVKCYIKFWSEAEENVQNNY